MLASMAHSGGRTSGSILVSSRGARTAKSGQIKGAYLPRPTGSSFHNSGPYLDEGDAKGSRTHCGEVRHRADDDAFGLVKRQFATTSSAGNRNGSFIGVVAPVGVVAPAGRRRSPE